MVRGRTPLSLRGKVVAITRPKGQAEELAEIIAERGGIPYIASTVEIKPVKDLDPVKEFSDRVIRGQVNYVVFMSINGVKHFMQVLNSLGLKDEFIKGLSRVKILAIGPRTKRELEDNGVKVDLIPRKHSSEGIVGLLAKQELHGKTIVILRTESPSEYLKRELQKTSAEVLEVPIYESAPPLDKTGVLRFIDDLLKGGIDAVTFTSSATAQNLFRIAEEHKLTGELRTGLKGKVVVAAVGPVTHKTLEKLGVKVHVVPKEYTIEAMVDAFEDYLKSSPDVATELDSVDTSLLQEVQDDFPLVDRPWIDVGNRLNMGEEEVIERLKRLHEEAIIQKIGPVYDARKAGLSAFTLIAMRVPKKRIEEVAQIVNEYNEVSHNYEREYEYNLWFTVTALNDQELARTLLEIKRRTGVMDDDILDLRAVRLFKIDARFQLE